MVEVNNTNDERHMYFLKLEEDQEKNKKDDLELAAGATDHSARHYDTKGQQDYSDTTPPPFTTPGKPLIFTNNWAKEFYVSPFNVQTGTYSIMTHDPLIHSGTQGPINTTLTLTSPEGRTLMVARVFSAAPAIDPVSLNTFSAIRFIAAWGWVGFVTFPRIVREAGKLFFKRKLQCFSKPEIKAASIGRNETSTEL